MSDTPFNACDYLCDKCSETERCRIYALLRRKVLSKQKDGPSKDRLPSLEDIKESLDEALGLLTRIAADLNMRFDRDQDMESVVAHCIENDDLYQLALTFTSKTHTFLKKIEPLITSDDSDAFDDAVWYHKMVSVKTHRAVAADYDGQPEDAVNSAGVATKSLTKCVEAFGRIGRSDRLASDEARILANSALEIRRRISKRFSLERGKGGT
jgi:hypothetical protein